MHPNDTVTLTRTDGQMVRTEGSQLCRSEAGVIVRAASTTRSDCAQGTPFARWADIASIRVEQFDGAATVGITTVAAGVVVVGVALAAGAFNSKSKGSSEKEPSGGRQSASPTVNGRTPAAPGVNGAPAPAPAPRGDSRGAVVAGGGDHHHHHEHHGGGTTVVLLGGMGSSSSGSYESTDTDAPAPVLAAPAPVASDGPAAELSAKDATPLFSARSERRALVRPLVRGELTGCVTQPTCVAGGARIGAIFANLVDVSGGLRVEKGADTTYWGVLGLGLHGAFPGAPAVALYLGTQLGFAGDNQFLVAPSAGVRLRPAGNLWLGLLPLGLTYYTKPGRAAYTPSLELGYDF